MLVKLWRWDPLPVLRSFRYLQTLADAIKQSCCPFRVYTPVRLKVDPASAVLRNDAKLTARTPFTVCDLLARCLPVKACHSSLSSMFERKVNLATVLTPEAAGACALDASTVAQGHLKQCGVCTLSSPYH